MDTPKLIQLYQSPWSERARWGFEFKGEGCSAKLLPCAPSP